MMRRKDVNRELREAREFSEGRNGPQVEATGQCSSCAEGGRAGPVAGIGDPGNHSQANAGVIDPGYKPEPE
jgi:hypothetical protein